MPTPSTDSLLHRASQYLASFGIQYLPKREDDSHTNLEWDSEFGKLITRKTEDGQSLILHFADLRIEWARGSKQYSLNLAGRSHGEVCVWLHHIALRCGLGEYDFYLHYTLDTGKIRPEEIFNDFDPIRAKELISIRSSAQQLCEATKDHFELDTEIRVWPHHFDTGGYSALPGSSIHVGFGMAIADSVVDDHYFYVSGYENGKPVNTEGLPELENGQWCQKEFNGATLAMTGGSSDSHLVFLKEAITSLSNSGS